WRCPPPIAWAPPAAIARPSGAERVGGVGALPFRRRPGRVARPASVIARPIWGAAAAANRRHPAEHRPQPDRAGRQPAMKKAPLTRGFAVFWGRRSEFDRAAEGDGAARRID